ncbi:MAG: SMI1/KNR4 family protein, partial [Ruminococcus sp.]|nr:SMI1/KNR4 family protein [Ruminococcus sp.]
MKMDNINLFFNELSFERLDDCLTEDEVISFEENNNVKIPAQYRNFLLHIGNGIKLSNGNTIRGIRRPVEKCRLKRISYRFLFKEGMNDYLNVTPKPYPRYDDEFPQYEDCRDTINLENGCKECKHYMECIDTC